MNVPIKYEVLPNYHSVYNGQCVFIAKKTNETDENERSRGESANRSIDSAQYY